MKLEGVTGHARADVAVKLLNLSLGGALLEARLPLEPGAVHAFALGLDGEPLTLRGEVRRCRALGEGAFEVAVQFIELTPEAQARLEAYLRRQPA